MMIGIFKKSLAPYSLPGTPFYAVFLIGQFCAVFVILHAILPRIRRPSCCSTHDKFSSSLRLRGTQ
jgi:hypothetical protein